MAVFVLLSKKVLSSLFEVTGLPKLLKCFRAAKPAKNENLTVFIRFAVHAAEAGLIIRGLRPLIIPI